MKKILTILFITFLLAFGCWIAQIFLTPRTFAAQDINLSAKVELVNPKGPTYYVWLRFKSLPGFDHIKVLQDGQEADHISPVQEYTDLKTGEKMRLSGVTYPPSGPHQYKVIVYDSKRETLGEGNASATVPAGSWQPSEESTTTTTPKFPPLKIIDFTKGRLKEAGDDNWVMGLFKNIINWFLNLAGALAVIAIVYSGLMYITSTGNPEKAEKAKKNLVWAVIAMVIITLALLIPQWVYEILKGT